MGKKNVKLNKRQQYMLIGAWAAVVLIVGACVFAAVWFTLGGSAQNPVAEATSTPAPPPTTIPATNAPAGAVDQPTPTTAGPTEPPVEPTLPPNEDPAFGYGIQVRLEFVPEDTLNLTERLGMNWVKQQVRWGDLELEPGQRNWDPLDQIFEAASRRNIKVMVSILDAPEWSYAHTTGADAESPPDDPQVYADYVGDLVERYKGDVHAVEVWNEQNLGREWDRPGALSAQEYMDLLIPTVDAIRAADPNVIIISGALTPTGFTDYNISVDDMIYLEQLINLGMLDYVDCVGAHPGGYNIPPDITWNEGYIDSEPVSFQGYWDNPHRSWSFNSTLNAYHDAIVEAGRSTPLCVTEFGWASVEGMGGPPRSGYEYAYDNTLQEQADFIVRAFELMHEWGFVKIAILFNLDSSPKAGGNPQDDSALFSILTGDGQPRPAFDAVRDMPKPP